MPRTPVVVRDEHGNIRMRDDAEKKRVVEIATALVSSQVEKGELNPDDPVALKAAMSIAVEDAVVAYRAAINYLES